MYALVLVAYVDHCQKPLRWRDTPVPHKKAIPLPFFWAFFRILWGTKLGKLLLVVLVFYGVFWPFLM